MKFSRVLFAIILLFIVVLGVFALPKFQISVAGHDLQWPGIDLSAIAPGSPWGNFRLGSGLYSSDQYRFRAGFTPEQTPVRDQIFNDDVTLIRRRMEAANLYDVDLTTQVNGGDYELVFTFPQYYHEIDEQRVAQLLVQPGNVSIWENNPQPAADAKPDDFLSQYYPGYVAQESTLVGVGDIASVSIETRTALNASVWHVKFADSVTTNLATAVANAGYATSSTPKPLIIAIDNSPVMVVLSLGQPLDMLARPFDIQTSVTELKVMSSYLLGSVGVRTTYQSNGTSQAGADFGTEGKSITSLAMILSAVFLAILAIRHYSRREAMAFVIGLTAYVLLAVAAFKLLAVSLSIGFFAGFLMLYALGAIVLYDLLRYQETQVRDGLIKYRNLGGLLFFVAGVMYVANLGFGAYQDILGVVSVGGLLLVIACTFLFPQIIAFIHAQDSQ